MKPYSIVAMMSGTSLDGMDLVLCRFHSENGKWIYEVEKAVTIGYSNEWKKKLSAAQNLGAVEFIMLHNEFGSFIGKEIRNFLGNDGKADFVASHGHTVFHQPDKRLTFQLGSPPYISAECMLPVVSDFRTPDVALGGQGAPLVPVGDRMLFYEYGFCLNLGGFANISNDVNGARIACDLCPVNIVANELSLISGNEYDRDGIIGRGGNLVRELTDELNKLEFYSVKGPKSLGREWVESEFMPVVKKYRLSVPDSLRSFYEHVSDQICGYINRFPPSNVLVTGGGAFNLFLMELIRTKCRSGIIIPGELVVKYKEAIIFAFLGLLRYLNQINCLASVTGARKDSSSGGIYLG